MKNIEKYTVSLGVLAFMLSAQARADDQKVFNLGEIYVSAPQVNGTIQTGQHNDFGGTVISNADMFKFSKDTLDQAVSLVPGVVGANSGGTRNERLIYVRGFDRFQVPLSIDGIRIYLPADNRLDMGRFLTADVAEVQIAKGYVSVLDGPGGMGGAINLVTRKPTKEVDGEMRAGMVNGRDGRVEAGSTYGYLGTRQPNYYLQASGNFLKSNGWVLSDDYTPTSQQGSGLRDHSDTTDWRINLRAALTPNATDEYSLSYIKQAGRKGAPIHVTDTIASSTRYWDWPYWNIQNIYFLSNTAIGESSYIKTRAFYNTFDNGLYSYDDANLTTMSLGKAFQSYYQDYAVGGSIEAGHNFDKWDTLKGSFNARRDHHNEWQTSFSTTAPCVANVVCSIEPQQTTIEDTYAAALENTIHISPIFDWVQGVSYNWRHLSRAEDYTSNAFVYYPLKDSDAVDWQTAFIYRYAEGAKVFANVSSRTRFPTIFERFSSRFGGATSNPNLKSEHATNYQIGWAPNVGPRAQLSMDVFYSDVTNVIESVNIVYNGTAVTQSQNVGNGHYIGAEVSGSYELTDSVLLGGNVSFIRRNIHNPASTVYQPTGVPGVTGFLYATWSATEQLSFTPSLELADNRWTANTAGTYYYKLGAYQLVNFEAQYKFNPQFTLSLGAKNLLDQNYQLVDGFPEAGRSFYANARVTF